MNSTGTVVIEATGVTYYSPQDEAAFFGPVPVALQCRRPPAAPTRHDRRTERPSTGRHRFSHLPEPDQPRGEADQEGPWAIFDQGGDTGDVGLLGGLGKRRIEWIEGNLQCGHQVRPNQRGL
ncbi:hypothetical protein [Nocardia sp. CY41]|uniref:hypothetical protein n=1 Tax=Nocardia sp. CY41 TaxID=2608686 RepID=UPI002E27CFB1|nr:hypothetical protein [Nocardia sp. CY41]